MQTVGQNNEDQHRSPRHIHIDQLENFRQAVIEQEELNQNRRAPEKGDIDFRAGLQHRNFIKSRQSYQKADNNPCQQRAADNQQRSAQRTKQLG
ncbi:hypothetical protein D3C80_1650840 [compost metagenome]